MHVSKTRLPRSRRLIKALAVVSAALMAAGLFLAGPAQASATRGPAAGGPATSIRPPVRARGSSPATAEECFYVLPRCSSSDPDAGFSIVSDGDTTGCTFKTTVLWGDHTKPDIQTFPGGPDGTVLAAFDHTYAGKPAFFKVKVTGKTTVGSCSAASGTLQFMLMCPATSTSTDARPQATVSENWAGYIARSSPAGTDCSFTSVTGQWVQPKVTCPATNKGDTEVDFWVGLDGSDSNTVEQTGVEVTCLWDTTTGKYTGPTYRAWHEMAPDPPVYSGGGFGSLSPKPGRTITATVTYDPTAETNPYNLVLTVTADGTTHTGNVNTTCLDAKNRPCRNVNAEWIAEEVDGRALASFKTWTLTGGYATTTGNPQQQSIAALNAEPQNLQPGGTKVLAYACNLNGASFVVQHSAC